MADNDRHASADAIRRHWAGIVETAHDAIAGKLDARKTAQLGDVLERFETDLSPHIAPLVEHLLDDPDVPEPIRNLLGEMANPTHFTTSLLIGIGVGGLIGPLLGSIVAPLVQDISNSSWPKNPSIPLSPPELALGMLRHNPSIGDPYAEAAKSGLSASRLDALLYNTGESLPVGELLLLYRRGQISEARLVTGLRQSRIRDEWLPEVLDLRFQPPGAGTVITGALKGHLSDADAAKRLGESGIDPANFAWMRASSGRPPGIVEMIGLWNRGYTSQARVEAAVRQSDINDDYLAEVLNLRWYHVPPRSIVPMLRSGSITEARARQLLSEHGVRPADQDAFILEATQHASANVKELSASQIARAYEEKLIPRATAIARLEALKYNAADSTLLLDMADAAVARAALGAATTRIHSLYVRRKITKAQASADLSKIGQPPAAITQLFQLWDEELSTDVPYPTVAQWVGAYRREVIDLPRCIAEVQKAGFTGWGVKVEIADGFPAGHVPDEVVALNPANL